jgi:hypothetical protein
VENASVWPSGGGPRANVQYAAEQTIAMIAPDAAIRLKRRRRLGGFRVLRGEERTGRTGFTPDLISLQ